MCLHNYIKRGGFSCAETAFRGHCTDEGNAKICYNETDAGAAIKSGASLEET
jgi:hypothetical protein